jgi:hypothetical protein
MAKETVITVGDAHNEFLIALKGLFAWNCGSIEFKAKVATLEREIRKAVSKELDELSFKEQAVFRKFERAKDEARAAEVQFVPTDALYDEDIALRREQMTVMAKEIKVKNALILASELPTQEEIDKQQPYSYSRTAANGQPLYVQYTPNTLVGCLKGVLIVDQE